MQADQVDVQLLYNRKPADVDAQLRLVVVVELPALGPGVDPVTASQTALPRRVDIVTERLAGDEPPTVLRSPEARWRPGGDHVVQIFCFVQPVKLRGDANRMTGKHETCAIRWPFVVCSC